MRIEWFGHSCFRINDSLVIDPYKDGSVPGYGRLRLTADKVICTHEHADHSGRECVELSGKACEFKISEIASWHDEQNGALRGPNTIFVIECNGEKLVHLGDLGHFPNDEQLAAINNADYLLLPVGGFYTIDGKLAAKICQAAQPCKIIPMHYRFGEHGYAEISTDEEFLAEIEKYGLSDRLLRPELSS